MRSFFASRSGDYDRAYGMAQWLYINNFGYYRNVEDEIAIARACGRADYQLIYVASGELKTGGQRILSGGFCIFAPHMPQVYTYLPGKNTLYYWVHFTGNKVMDIFEQTGLGSGLFQGNGRKSEAEGIFQLLSAAFEQEGKNTQYACALFLSLLQLIGSPRTIAPPFRRAAALLEDSANEVSTKELAALYHMTPEHFIRSFRKAYGTTPIRYRTRAQMEQAKGLLRDTQLTVSQIAQLCGYGDPLYFSRIFKKETGVCPSSYRKQSLIRRSSI